MESALRFTLIGQISFCRLKPNPALGGLCLG